MILARKATISSPHTTFSSLDDVKYYDEECGESACLRRATAAPES